MAGLLASCLPTKTSIRNFSRLYPPPPYLPFTNMHASPLALLSLALFAAAAPADVQNEKRQNGIVA